MSSRAVRVVHVIRRFEPFAGGMERYVGDLARAQAAAGRHVTVVTLDRDVNGIAQDRLEPAETDRGVQIVRLPGFGSPRFAVTTRPIALIRIVRRSDVVHLHDLRFMLGTAAIAARLRRRPVLLHTHGLIFGTRRWWRLKRLVSRLYYEPLLRATDTNVVAGSPADRARLLEHMPRLASATTTILSGANLVPFSSVKRSPSTGQIAVVGRVTKIKGIDRLLRVLSLVSSPWSLRIDGADEESETARLSSIGSSLGIASRMTFTGPFTTIDEPKLLETPALAVFPSRSESLGMALVDAMAAGTPVIASDIPAHRDVLGPSAPEALVDFDDPEVVAKAIDRLLRAPAPEIADLTRRLRERAEFFDVGRLVRELDELYVAIGVNAS